MPKEPERQYKVGEKVSVTLHSGRIVDATVRAIIERTDGKRLQVDYGKDQTALVELCRVGRLYKGRSDLRQNHLIG